MFVADTKITEPALSVALDAVPPLTAAEEKGKLPVIIEPAVLDIEVDPANVPETVTKRPTLVYLPVELNDPVTIKEAPWVGVQVPSS